jgi:hypothetical protein
VPAFSPVVATRSSDTVPERGDSVPAAGAMLKPLTAADTVQPAICEPKKNSQRRGSVPAFRKKTGSMTAGGPSSPIATVNSMNVVPR